MSQIVDEIYMGDLEKALLQSKVDFEATKQAASPSAAVPVTLPKSSKPVPLSLEEFHALDEKKPSKDAVSTNEPKYAT